MKWELQASFFALLCKSPKHDGTGVEMGSSYRFEPCSRFRLKATLGDPDASAIYSLRLGGSDATGHNAGHITHLCTVGCRNRSALLLLAPWVFHLMQKVIASTRPPWSETLPSPSTEEGGLGRSGKVCVVTK